MNPTTLLRSLMLLVSASCSGLPAHAQVQLPDFGDSSASVISAADEAAIGEAFMREIRATLTVVDDPEVESYIQRLGYRLVSNSDAQNIGFHFFVVQDKAVNAFAAPGGYIGIHSGLVLATESESELASVVGHEIAHITQRHIARSIELADRTNIPAIAGIIAAVIVGSQNAQAGQATAAAVIGTQVQNRIDFTRANEKEADRVGMQLLVGAGFDPRAMPTFFEKLQMSARYYRRPPEFLSTHPVTTSRIADTRSRAEQYPYKQVPDREAYHFVRAKLRVLGIEDPKRALAFFKEQIKAKKYANKTAAYYGLALSLVRVGNVTKARELLGIMLEKNPNNIAIRAALADSELVSGDVKKTLGLYADAYELFPDNRILLQGYSRGLLQDGQNKQVLKMLDDYGRLYRLDSSLYRLSAEAHEQAGRPVDSQVALAEHYYLNGQLNAAIHQLTLAASAPDEDFYRSSRIDARLQEIRKEQALRSRR